MDDMPMNDADGARRVPPTLKERNAVQRIVDQLLDELAPERALKRGDRTPVPVEAYRTPSGCILQGASSALSVSWFADVNDSDALGELQVVLWSGIVSRRGASRPPGTATVVRELVLRPIERPTDALAWRDADGETYDSAALAGHCLAMLTTQRDERGETS